MYRIRGSDQKEYGPVSADAVRQWIAERRANAQTLIQVEGTVDWNPLSTFPEFSEALKTGPIPPPIVGGAPPILRPLISLHPAPTTTSGMAIASLVLGILGLCTAGISALVGLILGIVALTKIKQSNGRLTGTGLAIAGICVSALFAISGLGFSAALILPNLARAKAQASTIKCISNLKQIGLAARMWSADHNNTFPADFLSMTNELSSPRVLTCAGDTHRTSAESWSELSPKNITYEYLAPEIKEDLAMARTAIFRCPIHGTVCYGDGSVEQVRGGWTTRPK